MSKEILQRIIVLVVAGVALALGFFQIPGPPFDASWIAILLCGLPILKDAAVGLFTRLDVKADVLVALALVASVIIGEDFAAGEVAFIMRLGSLLEDLTAARARAGIERLALLTPREARRLEDGAERLIPADEVRVGDLLRVLPGETVPADGRVVSGRAAVDEAVMTGEPLPADTGPGDPVLSGTTSARGPSTCGPSGRGGTAPRNVWPAWSEARTRARPGSCAWPTAGPPGSWPSPCPPRP